MKSATVRTAKTPAVRAPKIPVVRAASLAVTELNLRKTALRVLGQSLVSPEVQYIQRTLGASATQEVLDATVLSVRKMPWANIVLAE